ncbi:DUF393 domain-containing protein [Pedobacter yulinensis]|uniref:DUF393 domain-containing protein n=1 Tax=Pedobacter yulinensis TaxID=2126353 RepID=A0A2T3HPG6_9SPHI|nr:DUF393 domain-containing protein [Pedobacter yulinensis]PST84350.1 DUF393 domain-containing protein [Pedobacter yulinensis]
MKTLHHHLILFDAECPMCRAYTRLFTGAGILDKTGRQAYQELEEGQCPLVDRQRAVNEIALVNTQTGEVTYGIHSLLKVIGHAIPLLRPVFGFAPLIWLLSEIYAFVSYNRRVLVPAAARAGIQPDFRPGYRAAYLVFALAVTVLLLNHYTTAMAPLVPSAGPFRELWICSGQLLVQAIIMVIYARNKTWDYLGNMVTVSLAGAILLQLPLLAGKALGLPEPFFVAAFLAVAGLMLFEHMRRCRLLELGGLPTLTWLGFRLVMLHFIF